GDGAQTQTQVDFGLGQFARFQVLVHELFVGFGSAFNQLFTPFVGGILELGRNVDVFELGALAGFIPDDGLHLDEVDHTLEGVFGANGDHDGHRVGLQAQLQLVVDLEEVGTGAVHLVDESQTRHVVLVGLTPDRFRLGLNATHSAVNHAGAIEHAHGTLNFDGEVNVSRGVDDVDAVLGVVTGHATPERRRCRRRNGDATLLFLFH